MASTVDGKLVTLVERVTWQPDDDKEVRFTSVVGRAVIYTDGGGRLDALLVAKVNPRDPDGPTIVRAVAWERTTRRFVAFPLTHERTD